MKRLYAEFIIAFSTPAGAADLIAPRIPPSESWILSSRGDLRHGCLGNARRDWKYWRKLEQILKKKLRKQMQKILRIFTRIHAKSVKFIEKSFQ